MTDLTTLEMYLDHYAADNAALLPACRTIQDIAKAGQRIALILAHGPLAGKLGERVGDSMDGDGQKALDVMAHDILREALNNGFVRDFASEEAEAAELLDKRGTLAVATDPLDGSSNIDTLAPIGTIFSILPAVGDAPFLQPGRNQLAAGFLIYGPQTALVLTLGAGTWIFTLHPEHHTFVMTSGELCIASQTREYAINGSNQRHWEPVIASYINDLLQGATGPRGIDFNTRWLASMVADAYRILIRGGVYLYPADQRHGYGQGRLRLVYEANPIALVIEQAGGSASNGKSAILDLIPETLHQRCPLIFGASDEVHRIVEASDDPRAQTSPLFNRRSLFRNTETAAERRA